MTTFSEERRAQDVLSVLRSAFRHIGALEIDQGILAQVFARPHPQCTSPTTSEALEKEVTLVVMMARPQAWLPLPAAGGQIMLQTKVSLPSNLVLQIQGLTAIFNRCLPSSMPLSQF